MFLLPSHLITRIIDSIPACAAFNSPSVLACSPSHHGKLVSSFEQVGIRSRFSPIPLKSSSIVTALRTLPYSVNNTVPCLRCSVILIFNKAGIRLYSQHTNIVSKLEKLTTTGIPAAILHTGPCDQLSIASHGQCHVDSSVFHRSTLQLSSSSKRIGQHLHAHSVRQQHQICRVHHRCMSSEDNVWDPLHKWHPRFGGGLRP